MSHTDMMDWGDAWLQKQRRTSLARDVIYQRGTSTIALRATKTPSKFEADGQTFITYDGFSDWILNAEDLVIDDVLTEPANGDRIIDGDLDDADVYEVMPIAGERSWNTSGAFGRAFRIHTKVMGTQPPQR